MSERILIVDDDRDVASALSYLLKVEGYYSQVAYDPKEALKILTYGDFNLLLADLNYSGDTTSGREGMDFLAKIREIGFQGRVVVMTAWGNIELAVEAMRLGAGDFIQKPWDDDRLLSIIRNQILLVKSERKSKALEEKNKLLRQQIGDSVSSLVADSEIMQELISKIKYVAQSDASILFTGENGTGKSMLAEYVHLISPRRDWDMISVNMGSISESLFESEMFGHVKGAFTDAYENRIGRFELADKGTLFLDEIGNTPCSQQAKLLRVLETKQFERAGSSKTQISDCRLITATNSNLDDEVLNGGFRKDLLYRINTITLRVPSLRERKEDIPQLTTNYLSSFTTKYHKTGLSITEEAMEALRFYNWPGNIRELSHVIERAVILCDKKEVCVADLGLKSNFHNGTVLDNSNSGFYVDTNSTLEEIELEVIVNRLNQLDGNATEAAKSLGLSKSAIYRRLSKNR